MKQSKGMKQYDEISVEMTPGILTGIEAFDKFISIDGGIYPGNLLFVTGTSGAGKTTLAKLIQSGLSSLKSALYERETSVKALARQLKNIKINHKNAFICDDSDGMDFLTFMEEVKTRGIKFLIIDSLQAAAQDFENGGMAHDKACMHVFQILKKWKDENDGIVLLIGHVKKDGVFAGVNTIKQLSDAHVHLTFDEKSNTRWMVSSKNRMGGEVGVKLFYKFVKDDRIFEFGDKVKLSGIDKNTNFDEYLKEQVISYLEMIEQCGYENYELFITEFNEHVDRIAKEEKSKIMRLSKLIVVLDELSVKYGYKK